MSAVVLMHRDDLSRVAPRWLHYSEASLGARKAWKHAWVGGCL